MKKLLGLSTLLSLVLIVSAAILFNSCGDDEVMGCTDVDAENYDVNATVDSGNCTYARDKFLGSYMGMFTCPGALAVIGSDSIAFTIEESLDATNKNGILLNLTLASVPIPIALEGTVSGDVLSISSLLTGVTIPGLPVIGTIMGDVEGTGSATITSDVLTGNVTVKVISPALVFLGGSISDNCVLVGTKQ
jgi:hypothetical protein